MKKIFVRSKYFSVILVTFFIIGVLIKPVPSHALLSSIARDPDPCIDIKGKIVDGVTGVIGGVLSASVPVNDEESVGQLKAIKKNTCEASKNTASVKDKVVGNTFFGVPIPLTSWDGLFKFVMKKLVVRFTNSTVAWINSGFDGNPTFITDPKGFFADIANNISGEFIDGAGLSGLCSPFQNKIRLALRTQHISTDQSYEESHQCTLSKIGVNLNQFYGDFNKGGWAGWFEMTQNDSNNPYGAYLSAEIELNNRVVKKVELEKLQANWNNGFLSTKDCLPGRRAPVSDEQKKLDPNAKGECLEYGPTKTPGSVIENQLNKTLGQGVDDLGLARSFDDIVSALVGALTKKVFNNADGLFKTKSSYSSDGDTTYNTEPITFGGGSNTSSNTSPEVTCSANPSAVGFNQEVKWTAVVKNAKNPSQTTYSWVGTDNLSSNKASFTTTYTTAGNKSASVDATIDGKDVSATCTNTVSVTKIPPLQVSCVAGSTHAPLNTPVSWQAHVLGGSGELVSAFWNDTSETNSNEEFEPNVITKSGGENIVSTRITYITEGIKTSQVAVIDKDSSVAPILVSCSNRVIVGNKIQEQ